MKIYIDVGSSTVKIYQLSGDDLSLVEAKSFNFKDNFDPTIGITEKQTNNLINYLKKIKKKYSSDKVKVFATAIFRKMTLPVRKQLIDSFFGETGLYFNIIDHDLESFYLEKAVSSRYLSDSPLLIINIGGGSTELVVKSKGQVLERYNLEIGVGSVQQAFPYLNDQFSRHSLEQVVEYVKKALPRTSIKTPVAFYSGGELTYMQLVGYQLQPNDIFDDADHPYYVSLKNYILKNQEVFESITLEKLESLMPENPLWMHGARACSAMSQAISEHFGVKKLVPSDSNIIHGAIRQEYRTVVLSGSFRKHLPYIKQVKQRLEKQSVEILSPRFTDPKNPGEEFVRFEGEDGMSPLELERYRLDMIERSDALIVCDKDGYVGASALIGIGYAQAIGKRIIFTEKPDEYILQILPSEVGL